jgi:hypothetical protein
MTRENTDLSQVSASALAPASKDPVTDKDTDVAADFAGFGNGDTNLADIPSAFGNGFRHYLDRHCLAGPLEVNPYRPSSRFADMNHQLMPQTDRLTVQCQHPVTCLHTGTFSSPASHQTANHRRQQRAVEGNSQTFQGITFPALLSGSSEKQAAHSNLALLVDHFEIALSWATAFCSTSQRKSSQVATD